MRALLAGVLAACALAYICIQALSIDVAGARPVSARGIDFQHRIVTAVSPVAARAGFRVGDVLDFTPLTTEERLRNYDPRAGEPYVAWVTRSGRPVRLAAPATTRSFAERLPAYADVVMKLLGIALGVLLIARGRGRYGFFVGLALFGTFIGQGFNTSESVLSPVTGYAVMSAVTLIAFTAMRYLLVEVMIAVCGAYLRRAEIVAFRAFAAVVSVGMGAAWVDSMHAYVTGGPQVLPVSAWVWLQLMLRLDFIGYVLAFVRARDDEQRRLIAWVMWPTLLGFAAPTLNLILALAHQTAPLYGALNLGFFIWALGSAYVALRYRLVDLSFVVNRAVVYATVLAAIAGAFVVAETLVKKLALGERPGIIAEMALAIVLAFSIKRLEARVSRVVERLLFARKFAEMEGLRALVRDCAHVRDGAWLATNVARETRRLTGASHVGVYEAVDEELTAIAASPEALAMPPVNLDDLVVVRLRSTLAPVDLGDMASTLGSDGTAFPMLARGRLVGVLVCGRKQGREAYDPDERTALGDLAHEAATSLLFLRPGRGNVVA